MDSGQRVTSLPIAPAPPAAQDAPNPARDVASFVGEVMSVAMAPVDALNMGVAKSTYAIVQALPKFPAARLFVDLVFGWPHAHAHPPNLIPPIPPIPLPSIGPVICAGAVSVLINGMPSARCGDVGFGVWCGGFFPLFEVQTGSSHVFIGGARPARMLIDVTRHCIPGVPGLGKLGAAMMAFSAGMGALQTASSLTDMSNAEAAADSAETAAQAAAAAASASAAAVGATVAALQTAADLAAAALQAGMGKDPAIPPGLPIGNFLTGSPNVLIGGFPMPGWMAILRGLGKLLKPLARKALPRMPENSRTPKALCSATGHPVDIASGRVFTSQTDFELAGRIPIAFERAYDTSAVNYTGPLGPGWMHPYDIHLWEDPAQEMLILRNAEARVSGFDLLAVGEKTFNQFEKLWLERLEEQVYLLRDQNRLQYRFEAVEIPGMAFDEPDRRLGHSIFAQPQGRNVETQDLASLRRRGQPEDQGLSNHVGFSEAAPLRLTEISDRNGNRIQLFYEQGRLVSIKDSAGRKILFNYLTLDDGQMRLAGLSKSLDENNERTARLSTYSYDREGQLIAATDRGNVPWRYAYEQGLLVRETNRNGLSFHFTYKGERVDARCVHTWGDGGIYERRLSYDRESRKTVVENSLGAKTTYYFNEYDLPVGVQDALGGVKHFLYGPAGELLRETDELGRETNYSYDDRGNRLSVTFPDGTTQRFSYTRDGLPQTLTDEIGATFIREYDDNDNVLVTIDPLGNRIENRHTVSGDLTQVIDPLGGVTGMKWNDLGKITEYSTPKGATSKFFYDDRDRLIRVTDPLGQSTHYSYDGLDRLMQVHRPNGANYQYKYDPEGNLIEYKDANGADTRFRYVGYNKLGERIDARGSTRRFIHDTEARLIELRNERNEVHRFTYDNLNRLTREVGFDGLSWKYDYDAAGEMQTRIDPAGRVTRLIRDLRGQILERQRPDGSAMHYQYDPAGRLIEASAPGSKVNFEYDTLGQVISEEQNGQIIQRDFDSLGRCIRRHSPTGNLVEYSFDLDSRLSCLQTPGGVMNFEYDAAGRMTRRYSPGYVEESRHFDKAGRMLEQTLRQKNTLLFHREYQYDHEGNPVLIKDSQKGVVRFTYNVVDRLQEATSPEKKLEQFIYDTTDNLTQWGDRRFRYEVSDRLTHTNDAVLTYDKSGNLIEQRRAGKSTRYSYDTDNRLVAVDSDEAGRSEFAYDVFGRRISKKTLNDETRFLWDGDVLLTETHADRSVEYVFGGDSFEPLARFWHDQFESYHNNHLGTPQEITNDQGYLVWSAEYDAYGGVRIAKDSQSNNPIRFQGQYEDRESGLFYNRFRYYNPDLGRYITRDPLGIAGGFNAYSYTHNPNAWVDPLGLTACTNTVTYYRVQGGTPPLASRYHINIDSAGNVRFNNVTLNVSTGRLDHALYFQSKRPGSQIYVFEVPEWFHKMIEENAIKQKGYRSNPANQGGNAPKIVDPTTPGQSFELPPIWSQWLNEVVVPGSGRIL